ncbi:MAG: hypothetical protein AAGC46_10180 [Solirubrobacteraceae bacterium]|nr:hypothetical protein [Patulibacter sp.]
MPHSSALARTQHLPPPSEADRLSADFVFAQAAAAARPRHRNAWGIDPRVMVADLRRQRREA